MSGQICLKALRRNTEPSDPPFRDENFDSLPADNAVQAIITTYKFYCDCVNITSWETYVQPGGPNHFNSLTYDITFQVWRPSPTVNDSGCYSLVGENVFTSFSFTEGGLVQLSPPSSSIITAQSGDVVGYYTNSQDGSDEGIQLEREDSTYTENVIWYQTTDSDGLTPLLDSDCPYPVGSESDRVLTSSTNSAPMLRLVTSKKILIYLLMIFFLLFFYCLFVCLFSWQTHFHVSLRLTVFLCLGFFILFTKHLFVYFHGSHISM